MAGFYTHHRVPAAVVGDAEARAFLAKLRRLLEEMG
jgi:hypothetical protein